MIVAVDTHLFARNPKSGMGVYIKEILTTLDKIDKKNSYIKYSKDFQWQAKNILVKIQTSLQELYWLQKDFLINLEKDKVDLIYSPNPPVPFFSNKPIILTIPDLSFIYDKSFMFPIKFYLFLVYFFSAKKAKFITTFSENSKKDIMHFFHIPGEKIYIVTPAIANKFFQKNKKQDNNLKKIILSVPGTFIPRKNMEDLLNAFVMLPKDLQKEYSLVLVGNKEDIYAKKFIQMIKEKDMSKKVLLPGYVTEKKLLSLYRKASVFVCPSLYEGFGLPPLESMASCLPVIVYGSSSLPEVVGDSGIIVNSVSELSIALRRIITDKNLQDTLRKKGLKKAQKYSWTISAGLMKKIIDDIKVTV